MISNGVNIGTTGPGGKLDVNGTIYQRGSVLHADYVFEPDYKLESIGIALGSSADALDQKILVFVDLGYQPMEEAGASAAAIDELKAKNASLEARLQALESKLKRAKDKI